MSSLSIFEHEVLAGGVYMLYNGEFKAMEVDSNNIATFENLEISKGDYVSFCDTQYSSLQVTLDGAVDSSIWHKFDYNETSLVYFDKAGKFNVKLNLDTNVVSLDVIEIEEPANTGMTGGYIYFSKNGGNKKLSANPDNSDELCLKDMVITAIDGYCAVYDQDMNTITPSLASGSDQYASIAGGVLIYLKQTGTFNFYINKTTYVLRIEKTA